MVCSRSLATTAALGLGAAVLTKAQARKLAQIGHDGLARSIEPAHTLWDGDTMRAVATCRAGLTGNMLALGTMTGRVVAAAVLRAVLAARSVPGPPAVPSASESRGGG